MPGFSFIHAADLHLDSPFQGLSRLSETHPNVVESLRNATFAAFDSVIDYCLQNEVDFLLVAGDIYDGADRSLQAQLRFRDGLCRLDEANIRTYVVHGNHDPLDGWVDTLAYPDSVHTFGPELGSVAFEKQGISVAHIHGISYPSRRIGKRFGKGFTRSGEEPFQIGLFHCNAGGNTEHDPYAPRTENELVASSLDYWALGHIHESVVLRNSNPFIGYPGNTQGRHIKEFGPRGCFLAKVDDSGQLEDLPEFLRTDVVQWQTSELDIENIEDLDTLFNRIQQLTDKLVEKAGNRPVVTRIALKGSGPLHQSLARPNVVLDFLDELNKQGTERSPFIWVERLELRTRPEIDLAARRESQDFLGDLLKLIEEIRTEPESISEVRNAIADLYDNRRASRCLDPPDDSEIGEWLDNAESLCVDLFDEDLD